MTGLKVKIAFVTTRRLRGKMKTMNFAGSELFAIVDGSYVTWTASHKKATTLSFERACVLRNQLTGKGNLEFCGV